MLSVLQQALEAQTSYQLSFCTSLPIRWGDQHSSSGTSSRSSPAPCSARCQASTTLYCHSGSSKRAPRCWSRGSQCQAAGRLLCATSHCSRIRQQASGPVFAGVRGWWLGARVLRRAGEGGEQRPAGGTATRSVPATHRARPRKFNPLPSSLRMQALPLACGALHASALTAAAAAAPARRGGAARASTLRP